MSAIELYNCSNPTCDFTVSLHVNNPIWHENAPKEFRKVPIAMGMEKYVTGRTSEQFCIKCKQSFEVVDKSIICVNCQESNTFLVKGDQCPKCGCGIIENDWLTDVVF